MTTLKERFENHLPKWPIGLKELTLEQARAVDEETLVFFGQELLALAEAAEHAQANGEAVSELIRSKANELL